ncbi:hypothetical protein GCM10025771_34270 [Niveibacterium umoris]
MRRRLSGVVMMTVLLCFAHPVRAEGMRFGHGFERHQGQSPLREELRAERRETRQAWRDRQIEGADDPNRARRLDARFEQEGPGQARRLTPEERRQLRRELQDAARELYSR